ncbi:hypothetical protein JYU34_011440 [Plutella xylostella]|uniref:Uncharacterized protein n=1 Tax=Plutella xylostella TaxID=51655 RepID=A0ABQ7QKM5_PLUXY|nr:hypothetical protein JYU34_011440 [Plutella xylostella]
MFTTPPPLRKMVQTRSAHEREKMALLEQSTRDGPSGLNVNVATSEKITTKNELKECEPPVRKVGSCMKMEIGCHKSSTSKKMSMASSKRSIEARKKQLELEAAEAIANINKKLIEKKLEADIAALEDCSKNSAASYSSVNVSQKVEQWLEHSHHDANDPPRPSTIPPPSGEPRHDAAALPSTVRDIAQSPPPPPPPPAQPPSDMQQLVQAMKDIAVAAATSTPHSQMLSRLSTPRDLPTFAGDPLEWLNFVQAYEESTEVCHFTPKENMWRLRKCLRGPARDSVTALLVTAAAPETVMGALQLQYGNPDVILPRIIQDLNRLHAVSDDYQKDIISFSVKVQNYVAAVLALGRDEYLQGMSIASVILSKLPPVLISKWSDYGYSRINERYEI